MKKKFNITGACFPDRHYMADISGKLRQTMAMVDEGEYFVINRPRQYGKTTILAALTKYMLESDVYLPLNISFEGIGSKIYSDETLFCKEFLLLIETWCSRIGLMQLVPLVQEARKQELTMGDLSRTVSTMAEISDKPLVLLVDEVDKSSNNQLFLDFLGMLRSKFLSRPMGYEKTFHSVILAGVHDVKSLKLKLRPEEEQKLNSPWNIASNFNVEMSLLPSEIVPMLEEYSRDRGVSLDAADIAGRLVRYTSGYPFLVSNLCKIMDEQVLPSKTEASWTADDLEKAVNLLLMESNPNFDSLFANIENNPELRKLVEDMVLNAANYNFTRDNPVVTMGFNFGIFRNGNGTHIHNWIYAQRIYHFLISKLETGSAQVVAPLSSDYVLKGTNILDMEKLLVKFQGLLREQSGEKDRNFLEREGRLIFLAFLKPILNGSGYAFCEAQVSDERRLDVAITFREKRYVAELKIWHGEAKHREGLVQLSAYLDTLGLDTGYLLIFDHSKRKKREKGWTNVDGKRVFCVWV